MTDDQATDGPEEEATWVRSAFWIGRPRDEAAFRAAIVDDLIPRMRKLPGVATADSLWSARMEDGPPAIYCQILVYYRSGEDLALMLASPERAAMREGVRALAATFDGTISHIDYEVAE